MIGAGPMCVLQEQYVGLGCACGCGGVHCRIERESFVPHFLRCVCECGVEASHQSAVILQWNFPNSEESQQMVYAVGVKVVGHLAETGYKP